MRDAGPEHRLVVDQQHADRHADAPGIVTSVTQRPELSPARIPPTQVRDPLRHPEQAVALVRRVIVAAWGRRAFATRSR